MKLLKKDDYTVGWYAPLAVPEMQAALHLLDEEHEQISFTQSPRFLYAYGEMNGHNVVIATSPYSDMGLIPAAQVTDEMQAFHPQLRFCLLVGVGGAVSRFESRDVRLGDVVVGVPDREAQHGGVIHYDFGKAMQDGVFQPIGSLNRPPATLLSAVSLIMARTLLRTKFSEYLSSYQTSPDQGFSRPPGDILFPSQYHHKGRGTCTKIKCDQEQQITRDPRRNDTPVVHYGTIASGNSVMKDSRRRDDIADQDETILCFEMEAAGIANSFPCLAIRGMCDYSDSHKQGEWQPFAAAAAASFAKTILSMIPPNQVGLMKTISDAVSEGSRGPTFVNVNSHVANQAGHMSVRNQTIHQ